jgi:multiple sugar transport system permease protein
MTSHNKNKERRKLGRLAGTAVRFIVLAFIGLVILAPLAWMLVTSLKTKNEMYTFPVQYWPDHPTFENYIGAVKINHFGRYFLNSLCLAIIAPAFTVLFGTMAAYVLTKVKFRGSPFFLLFFLMTQMLPSAANYAPIYLIMAKLRLTDMLPTVGVILMAGGIPFSIIMLRGFLAGLPNALEESAFIDGCTRLQSFFRIVLPLMTSGIFTVFIFQFIGVWNDMFTSILYLTTSSKRTLAAGIYMLVGKYDTNWGMTSAGTIISLIPIIILFGLMKDMFIEGIVAGSVKE